MTAKINPTTPVITNQSTPSTQTNTVIMNNNNNKMSEQATSIITAPLAQANNMQKTGANIISSTTTAPKPSTNPGPPPVSSTPTPAPRSTPISAPDPKPNVNAPVSSPTPPVSKPPIKPVTSPPAAQPTPTMVDKKVESPKITATPPPQQGPAVTKPTELKSMMNGAGVMKQPVPPVTVFPPTPIATPPPIHKQPQIIGQGGAPSPAPAPPQNNNTTTTNQNKPPVNVNNSGADAKKSEVKGASEVSKPVQVPVNNKIESKSVMNEGTMSGVKPQDCGDAKVERKNLANASNGEIGDDVKRIMSAIEDAGLCGPAIPENDLKNRVGTAVERPGTAVIKTTSPTKGRPSIAKESSGIPTPKKGKETVAPASGNSSTPAQLPPKSGVTGRTSTPRVASAKASPSTIATKSPNEKRRKTAVNGGAEDSPETGASATGSKSTPRLQSRPTSSLYKPTASSALKGVSGAASSASSHNLPSPNQNQPRTPRSSTGARTSRSAIAMGDSAGGSGDAKPAPLKEQFMAFARFGNKEEDGKHITLSNCDKWMKQAKVIDGKKITTTDTSICFKKLFKTAKKITFEDYKKYVEELAKSKKIEPQELLDKLSNCGPPGLSSATRAAHSNVVDRLTDTSKYTGSHKERFDASGKGRGIEGRKDVPDGSGYVAAFKEKLDLKEEPSTSPTPAK